MADERDYGPGCDRHRGDPHNLCEACWASEPDVCRRASRTLFTNANLRLLGLLFLLAPKWTAERFTEHLTLAVLRRV